MYEAQGRTADCCYAIDVSVSLSLIATKPLIWLRISVGRVLTASRVKFTKWGSFERSSVQNATACAKEQVLRDQPNSRL